MTYEITFLSSKNDKGSWKLMPCCFAGQQKPSSDLGYGIDGPYPAD